MKKYSEIVVYNPYTKKEKKIKVLKKLSTSDIYDISESVAKNAYANHIYNPVLTDALFYVNAFYILADFVIPEEDRLDPLSLYDKIQEHSVDGGSIAQNGENDRLVKNNSILESLTLCENLTLAYNYTIQTIKEYKANGNNIVKALEIMSQDFIPNAKEAVSIMEGFDGEKYQQIVELAKKTGSK